MNTVLLWALSYLIGSIPFSYLVTRLATGQDIRYIGEGNVGGRNVWHSVGPLYGAIAGLLDLSKGVAVFLLASRQATSELAFYGAGAAAILGHGFPFALKGRGGKGISVVVGFLLGIMPRAIIIGGVLFGIAWVITRNFNVSAAVGLGSMPFLGLYFGLSLADFPKVIALMSLTGFKKIVDRPHERRIRRQSGWFEPEGIIQRRRK